MKKKKYDCDICGDTGEFTNPFDQTFKCKCKEKKIKKVDYRGFVLHIWEWNSKGISYGMTDLKELAIKYNIPIPKEYK